MKKSFRLVTMWYIVFLGSLLGAGLFAGIVVAPTIFHSELYLGTEILSHFQEGLIMTINFQKLGYLVDIALIIIFFYEGYKYKKFERDTITHIAIFFAISTGMLFSHYYIPDIITMQLAGEEMTKSMEFINTHKGSEINFKIFSLAILVILIRNLQKALR